MGTFKVTIEVGNPQGTHLERVEALVDIGASDTVLPMVLLERLGVQPMERWPFRLADGRQAEYETSQTQIRIGGRTRFAVVVFGNTDDTLLGASTLETFGLGVDPVGRKLVPVPRLLMAQRRARTSGQTGVR